MISKLLVTGSEGFIGKHLLRRVSALNNWDIHSFDIQDGDICDSSLPFTGIDHVVHLAGRTFIPDSWKDPQSFYRTNVQGTINVLEFCRHQNASLTYISAYVYGRPKFLPITEEHPLAPNNPYMHSKVLAESACEFFALNYKIPVTILRPFNIMGPGQRDDFLIPHLVRQLMDPGQKEIRVKDLNPKRDYLYIDDLLDAIISSFSTVSLFETFNIGSGESYSVKSIINILMKVTGMKKDVVSEGLERKNEVPDVRAGISKIKNSLGWEPQIDFEEGIKRIVNSYSENEL